MQRRTGHVLLNYTKLYMYVAIMYTYVCAGGLISQLVQHET